MAAANRLWNVGPTRRQAGAETRPRVCIVNDDHAVLVSLQFMFNAAEFAVRAYASGRSLLASPSIRTADCFVIDHKPRGADGLLLARRLRGLGVGAPIVLTTGLRSDALEALPGAVDCVIPTPRVDDDVIQRLTRMIAEARRPP